MTIKIDGNWRIWEDVTMRASQTEEGGEHDAMEKKNDNEY